MARIGDTIEHPVTGERVTFLETSEETSGEYATFELRVRPHDFGYLAKPPLFVQPAVFAPLGAVARMLGYRLPRPYSYAPAQRPDARGVREEVAM